MRIVPVALLLFVLSVIVSGQRNIRSVDFKNFEYPAYCADEEPSNVRVSNGEFLHRGKDNAFDYLHFWVHSVEFGDLDGDSRDEAIVITVCHPGGTGKFSEGFIFSSGRSKPRLVGRFPGGDRAAGGLASAVVRDGRLLIERNEERGGLCCPNTTLTSTYLFSKGQLTETGTGVRKELYPATRLESSNSGNDVVIQTTIDYKNRYVISGKRGQILSVTTDRPDSPIYGFSGGERIDDGMKGLKSRFDKDGDIVFDIYDNGDNPRTHTITIRIDDTPPLACEIAPPFWIIRKTKSSCSASYITYEESIFHLIRDNSAV